MEFRLLRADEIDCRIAMVKEWGISLLLYKDARCDMNILDETVGMENWQRKHELINGNLFCSVGIYVKREDHGEWVWKQDVGTESYTEKEKGQASDSFKRACFNLGIGRELYTAPTMMVYKDKHKFKKHYEYQGRWMCQDHFRVTDIEYNGKRIVKVDVLNESTGELMTFCNPAEEKKKTEEVKNKKIGKVKGKAIVSLLQNAGQDVDAFLKYFGVNDPADLTEEQHLQIVRGLEQRNGDKGKN